VDIESTYAIVCAWHADYGGLNRTGSAYIYSYDGTSWSEWQQFIASDGEDNDEFGVAVCTNQARAIIGAWLEDEASNNCGAAYIFDDSPAPLPALTPLGIGMAMLLISGYLVLRIKRKK